MTPKNNKDRRVVKESLLPVTVLIVTVGICLFASGTSLANSNLQALSRLCKKLMYKNCNPERDRQLQKYFGDTEISVLEKRVGNYPGKIPAFKALPKDKNGLVD